MMKNRYLIPYTIIYREIPNFLLELIDMKKSKREKLYEKFIQLITKDFVSFLEYILFIDSFERESQEFKKFINLYMKIYKDERMQLHKKEILKKRKNYSSYISYIEKNNKELYNLYKRLFPIKN